MHSDNASITFTRRAFFPAFTWAACTLCDYLLILHRIWSRRMLYRTTNHYFGVRVAMTATLTPSSTSMSSVADGFFFLTRPGRGYLNTCVCASRNCLHSFLICTATSSSARRPWIFVVVTLLHELRAFIYRRDVKTVTTTQRQCGIYS